MNEVNIMNIGGIDHEIDDQRARDVIAHSENGLDPQSNLPISSRHYDEGDYVIGQDRLYYEVTADINIGDVMAVGTNLRETIVSEELVRLKNQSALAVIATIAYNETGALATRTYEPGDFLYWDYGLSAGLYEVAASIGLNDPLAVNVNIKPAQTLTTMIQGINNEISDIVNVLGAKNLLPNEASSQVVSGVTFTVNSDGSVTANGTVAGTYASLRIATSLKLPKGKYRLSGCASGFQDNVAIHCDTINVDDFGGGADFELLSDTTFNISINAGVGVTFNNTKFYPMIRPSHITDDAYVPYTMANKELMKMNDIKVITPTKTSIVNSFNFVKTGHVVSFYINARPTRAAFSELFTNAPKLATGEMYISGISSGGAILKSWCGIYNSGLVRVYANDSEVNTNMLFAGTYITRE